MSNEQKPLYAERDASKLEPYFSRHMLAMTGEGLHSKAAIACELAYRDQQIATLQDKLDRAVMFLRSVHQFPDSVSLKSNVDAFLAEINAQRLLLEKEKNGD